MKMYPNILTHRRKMQNFKIKLKNSRKNNSLLLFEQNLNYRPISSDLTWKRKKIIRNQVVHNLRFTFGKTVKLPEMLCKKG